MKKKTIRQLAFEEAVQEYVNDCAKITIRTVASAYILKHKIEDACVKTGCNIINKYVFKEEKPMFE